MGFGIKLEVWGDYALFSRPEMKVERVSYDIMTPSAARGIIEAVYWKPAIQWIIDRIYVCNPIATTNIRRNEVGAKISASKVDTVRTGKKKQELYLSTNVERQQRASLVLKNVRYIIEAHFELTEMAGVSDTEEKHYNIIMRRVKKGQFYHMPYFGCREFPANFKLWEGDTSPIALTKDLGYMLYDMKYEKDPETGETKEINPMFFRANIENGILDLNKIKHIIE